MVGAGVGALGGYIWTTQMTKKKAAMEQATAGSGVEVTQTADNISDAGRARNRRIEIYLAERAAR